MELLRDGDIDMTPLAGKRVAILGYGNQGRAQALNLKDSGIDVVVGLRGASGSARAAEEAGVRFVREAFVDRGYRSDGTLVPRTDPGALLSDDGEIAARAVRMVTEGRVVAADGTDIPVGVDSLCVHGDTPGAVAMALAVRDALAEAGVSVEPFA